MQISENGYIITERGANPILETSKALVTYKGIFFQNKYYTCQTAIKCRWYELAWVYGDWEIDVHYNLGSSCESILIQTSILDEKETCNLIRKEEISGQKLEGYIRSIQQLKQIRGKRRSSEKVK